MAPPIQQLSAHEFTFYFDLPSPSWQCASDAARHHHHSVMRTAHRRASRFDAVLSSHPTCTDALYGKQQVTHRNLSLS